MKPYPQTDAHPGPILGVAMSHPGRLYAPGGTIHVVARRNNREFYFITPEDFEVLLAPLGRCAQRMPSRSILATQGG